MEGSTDKTIDYLRARLLAERSVSKTAKQRANELAKRVRIFLFSIMLENMHALKYIELQFISFASFFTNIRKYSSLPCKGAISLPLNGSNLGSDHFKRVKPNKTIPKSRPVDELNKRKRNVFVFDHLTSN